HLGKFDGKSDEGFFVGYSINSKAFRVYNTRTRKVEENLHINFLEYKPIITSDGPKWLFDIDALTESMNYVPIIAGTNSNDFAGKGTSFDTGQSSMETGPSQDYILMPLWNDGSLFDSSLKDSDGDNKNNDGLCKESEIDNQERANAENSTKDVNTVGSSINIASSNINIASPTVNTVRQSDDFFGADNNMRSLDGVEVDIRNISTTYHVPATLNTRIHKDHSLDNGFTQEEGINYDEVFSPVARIEAIRLFLAYASFMGFLVYQMDIKSAFLYGRIEDEVCVCQPPGFEHPDYPDKVYKVEKALYGLNQAPRACSTKKELCTKFEKLMHDKFQMSSMGELTFFLGFQVKQKSDGIFISHDKYIDENLRKFKYTDFKPASTLMDKEKALLKDLAGDDVDVHLYSSKKAVGRLKRKTSKAIEDNDKRQKNDEARIAQENLAQAEQWDDVQAQIQADDDLAQRMLGEERESLSIKERSRLLTEFINKRKKMLAAKRAGEKRNKPPT
nr:hypothetical protein [Tanacetum cinerariifolium]